MRCRVQVLSLIFVVAAVAYGQNAPSAPAYGANATAEQATLPTQPVPETGAKHHKKSRGAGAEVGSGAGDIGKGTAKGAGDLAKGTGKGAVDLATLHPLNAATDIGKGAGEAGGHVAVGAAKGTGKIAKGTAKAIKKVF